MSLITRPAYRVIWFNLFTRKTVRLSPEQVASKLAAGGIFLELEEVTRRLEVLREDARLSLDEKTGQYRLYGHD